MDLRFALFERIAQDSVLRRLLGELRRPPR